MEPGAGLTAARRDGGERLGVGECRIVLHYGLPIASYGRGLFAFGQHYSVRFCDTYPAVCGAAMGGRLGKWFALSFGPGNVSLSHMLAANPNAFLSHVSLNFLQLVATVLSMGFAVPCIWPAPSPSRLCLPVSRRLRLGLCS